MLTVHNLTKKFTSGMWPFTQEKTHTAVNNISFSLKKGEILGFLGPNGAGKTTTIQMLLGTLTPTSGTIYYNGLSFQESPTAALKKIGYASGYEKLPPRLTVAENLDIVGRIYGIPGSHRAQQIEHLLNVFGIHALRDRQTGTLSAGQATRVMLAKAFIANPDLVLLDEPTASLDPDVAQEVRNFILEQRHQRNIAMLITSHNMDEVTTLCDRVIILKQGSIIANDTPQALALSLCKVRVHLTITENLNHLTDYMQETKRLFTTQENQVVVELDEQEIAYFLMQLSKRAVVYSAISIDKPTLEDYFLTVARHKEIV